MMRFGLILIVCLVIVFTAVYLVGHSGIKPKNLGSRDGKLAPCPESPNCVSSQVTDRGQRIEPLAYAGDPGEIITNIEKVVNGMPGCKAVTVKENYLHAQCASRVFGFIDDVEFLVASQNNLVHMRSAARFGYYDFGVNRNRMERIRSLLGNKPN